MRIVYLLSGPLKEGGFPKDVRDSLKKDLIDVKNCTLICTKPKSFDRNDNYKKRMIRDLLEVANIKKVSLLDDRVNASEGIKILNSSDLIYLIGGDPIKQLDYIKKNHYDESIKNSNCILIGTSAGAVNLTKTAYYSKDDFINKSFFYEGLGIVDFTIDPHFYETDIEILNEFKKFNKIHKIYGLDNDSGIRIKGKDIKVLGKVYEE